MTATHLLQDLVKLIEQMSAREMRLRTMAAEHKGYIADRIFYAAAREVRDYRLELESIIEGYNDESV